MKKNYQLRMKLLYVLFIAALVSCTPLAITGAGLLNKENYIATYTQWSDEYAVTVSHYAPKLDSEMKSPTIDLKFFKKKSMSKRNWAKPKTSEVVYMTGYSKNEYKIIVGKLIPELLPEYTGYRLIEGTVEKGMSGGPVLNQQGQIIGINIGYSPQKIKIKDSLRYYTLFLPYETIEDEWNKLAP